MNKISVIVSCYNEELSLPIFYKEMERVREQDFTDVSFEYIFVDDGSSDKTLDILRSLCETDRKVKFISFSRNFGKEAAMYAGLEKCSGEYVTFMDADLQDPPMMLRQMYDAIMNEGYDQVGTRRISREGEPRIRSFFARMFYKIINKISKVEMVDGARDYRLITRKVVEAVLSMKEYNRYSKGMFGFVGFNTKWLEYKNVKRAAGETKWSFGKLFLYAIEGIVAFSTVPLIVSSILGLLFFLITFVLIVVIIIKTLLVGDPTSGWPSLVCIIFFVSGIQLFSLGVIGQYLAKTYSEIKKRPIYIVKQTEEDMKLPDSAHLDISNLGLSNYDILESLKATLESIQETIKRVEKGDQGEGK